MRLVVVLAEALLLSGCGPAPTTLSPAPTVASAPELPNATGSALPPPSSPAAVATPGGRIVFERFDTAFGDEGDYLGTFVVRPDGSDEQQVFIPVESAQHEWSRDGARLVSTVWIPPVGPVRPAIANADGSGYTQLKPRGVDGDVTCSDWSPDDTTLVCSISGNQPDPDGIYLLRIRGSRLTRLTHSPFHVTTGAAGQCGGGEGHARYSPDGSMIAFIRHKCGSGPNPSSDESAGIELMNANGSHLREIVPQGRVRSHAGSQLSWSPDGRLIAFGSQEGQLFLVDVGSGAISPIPLPTTLGAYQATGIDWSPDGERLVFSMFKDDVGSTDLYTISPDGGGFDQITDSRGAELWARWGVDPNR
jgi:Tol biopolymer transport system component